MRSSKKFAGMTAVGVTALLLVCFQNCSNKVNFTTLESTDLASKLGSVDVCNGVSCELTPLTRKPAVTTILLALGDEASSQLVINGASSQLIAETVVRYSTPQDNPRILLVVDSKSGNEDPEDTAYVENVLLQRYHVSALTEPVSGLTDDMLSSYDLIWFNNPGAPMGVKESYDALLRFKGGIILQGDDLTRGSGFSMTQLTGLHYVDNGTSVTCNGITHQIDNNLNGYYNVTLDPSKIRGDDDSTLVFSYGNDIDLATPARTDLEVLATARGGAAGCVDERPTIVRYLK